MTFDDLKPLVDWLQANPGLAGFATFVISIAESLAIIGLLIPGTLVMGAIGTLIGAGILPGIEITLWAIAGAIVGDGMSYWLGYHYHGHIREMWPFRSYPALLRRGENFFLKYGGMSVFMGRFIGPIRPIIPVVAGMMSMPPARFTIANVGSAVAWAPAYMMPGILLGALSLHLAPQTGTRFLVGAVIALLVLWFFIWLLKIFFRFLLNVLNNQIIVLWQKLHPQRRVSLHDPSQLALAFTFIVSFLILLGLTVWAYQYGAMTDLNTIVLKAMISIRFPAGDNVMATIVLLSNLFVLSMLFVIMAGWLLMQRDKRTAYYWIALGVITTLLVALLQWLVLYTHAQPVTTAISKWAFPCHSAALYTALFGYLAFLLSQKWSNYRTWIYSIFVLLISFILLADLYLAVHSFNAIVAGVVVGICCTVGIIFLYRRRHTTPPSALGLVIVTILALVIAWSSVIYRYDLEDVLGRYAPLSVPPTVLNTESWWSLKQQPEHLYREDGRGQPVELLKIQWMGNLNMIERELRANGWEVVNRPDLATLINRMAAKNRFEQLPLFPKLYLNRKAHLVMIRRVGQPERLLVLRLWDSNIRFDTPPLPLWIGSINYNIPVQPFWKTKKIQPMLPLEAPMDLLTKALTNFTWKAVPTSVAHCMERLKNSSECEGSMLLIKFGGL